MENKAFSKADVIKLINLYRENEPLWNLSSVLYQSLDLKKKGWEYIAAEMNMSVDLAKKKMKSLRSTFVSEKRKIEISKLAAGAEGDIYEPNLFYFDAMSFLDESVCLRKIFAQPTDINVQHDIGKLNRIKPSSQLQKFDYVLDNVNQQENVTDTQTKAKRKKPPAELHLEGDFESRALTYLENLHKNDKDEATLFADIWAHTFRKLTEQQKIYAKKAIDDILTLGQLNQLTLNCVSSSSFNSTPTHAHPSVKENISTLNSANYSATNVAPTS